MQKIMIIFFLFLTLPFTSPTHIQQMASPLHKALLFNKVDILKYLIHSGADVNRPMYVPTDSPIDDQVSFH